MRKIDNGDGYVVGPNFSSLEDSTNIKINSLINTIYDSELKLRGCQISDRSVPKLNEDIVIGSFNNNFDMSRISHTHRVILDKKME